MKIFSKALAEARDKDQGKFLSDFVEHLAVVCKDYSSHESQICYIADEVSPLFVEFCKAIVEFRELRNETRQKNVDNLRSESESAERHLAKLREQIAEKELALNKDWSE
jgi:hypothetical protein